MKKNHDYFCNKSASNCHAELVSASVKHGCRKILSALASAAVLFCFSGIEGFSAVNKQIDANIRTKRAPAGTIIPLKILDPAGSGISKTGDSISFSVTEDIKSNDNSVVIPAGSIVRGSAETVKPAGMLYKGGVIRIYFDHIVSTSGRQVPFYALICRSQNVTFDGALSTKTTYRDALGKTAERTGVIASAPVKWAWEKGDEVLNGYPKYAAAPLTAIVSVPAAGIYFIGDSIADIFKKGSNITVNQGDILYVQLTKPLDMPVY